MDLPEGKKLSFQEYELLYKSTEKVVDWRYAASRWNHSVCLALLVAIAVVFNWGFFEPDRSVLALVVIVVLSAVAIFFCRLWVLQIDDFKALNREKFAILEEMAECLAFSHVDSDPRVSCSPFSLEWKRLDEKRRLEDLRGVGPLLKSNKLEYYVPWVFILVFGLISLAALCQLVFCDFFCSLMNR